MCEKKRLGGQDVRRNWCTCRGEDGEWRGWDEDDWGREGNYTYLYLFIPSSFISSFTCLVYLLFFFFFCDNIHGNPCEVLVQVDTYTLFLLPSHIQLLCSLRQPRRTGMMQLLWSAAFFVATLTRASLRFLHHEIKFASVTSPHLSDLFLEASLFFQHLFFFIFLRQVSTTYSLLAALWHLDLS